MFHKHSTKAYFPCFHSESFKISKVIALNTKIFEVREPKSTYDQNQGYTFVIGLKKGSILTSTSAPFIPEKAKIREYLIAKGISTDPAMWDIGHRHIMYVPFPASYNLQKIVNLTEIRQVMTKVIVLLTHHSSLFIF